MKIIKIKEATSSNSLALEMLEKQDLNDGTLIWVENQTNGRGQNNNVWESESGQNLTFSIILKPSFLKPEHQAYLSKIVSLGLADYVGLFCSEVSVKWFNDIYIKNKKVAGILIENTWLGQKINTSVIGIGLNLNQEKFPTALPNAVSLKMMTEVPFVLEESLKLLHGLIMTRYEQLKESEFKNIDECYNSLLYRCGKECSFVKDGEIFKAVIIKVEPNGHIQLKHSDGKVGCYGMHEVRMI
jgi:BirA family biotin operon repressor/biotin-[acetyl-CoA-carboxylase] ligase